MLADLQPKTKTTQFGEHFEAYRKIRLVAIKETSLDMEYDSHKLLWGNLITNGFQGDELDVDRSDILAFAETIFKRDDIKANTKRGIVSRIKPFYEECIRQDWIMSSPYVGVKLPKEEKNPIKTITKDEMKKYLDSIPLDTAKGLRDRALLELMYSSALRASDIPGITKESFERDFRTIKVVGKGDKQCVLPVTKVASHFLTFYAEKIRKGLNSQNCHTFFLTSRGQPFTKATLYQLARNYGDQVFEDKFIGTHVFRYSCISHLAQNGVDVRVLQEFCRHEKPSTTMRYIQENFKDLETTFQENHPRSK